MSEDPNTNLLSNKESPSLGEVKLEETNNLNTNQQFKTEARRWAILFVFGLLSFSNGNEYATFPPISILASEYYKINIFWINTLTNLFFIWAIPSSFIVPWTLEKSLKKTVRINMQ